MGTLYCDNDISAFSGKVRPRYRALLADIKTGLVDGLLAWNNDRLHRNNRELEDFIDIVQAAELPLQVVRSGTYDLTTSNGRMTARIIGATAQAASEEQSTRIRRQRQQQAELGIAPPNRRSYGYTAKRAEVIESEAEVIREAAARILSGDSLTGICRDLHHRGISTTRGNPFPPITLKRILTSDYVQGLRKLERTTHGRKELQVLVPGVWTPILDSKTVGHLRMILQDPKRDIAHPPGGNRGPSLLTGLLLCGKCETPMYRGVARSVPRYSCRTGPRFRGCGAMSINAEYLEEDVTTRVLSVIDEHRASDAVASREAEIVHASHQLEARIEDIDRRLANDQITVDMWASASKLLHEKLTEAREAEEAEARINTKQLVTNQVLGLAGRFHDLTVPQQKVLLTALIETIMIRSSKPAKYDPDRVAIRWRV